MTALMTDAQMRDLLEQLQATDQDDVMQVDQALEDYPGDARLHFLKASSCANAGRHFEAYQSFEKAVQIAPDFHLARFQFGFFQLTSGEADNALQTLAPLCELDERHYLNAFATGLGHLVRDELQACIAALRKGQGLNSENPALNGDMQLIIDKLGNLVAEQSQAQEESADETSMTAILLQQSGQATRH
ncbi:MAG: hypothetical protein AAF926_00090 [Pseudomonadota bacterium]